MSDERFSWMRSLADRVVRSRLARSADAFDCRNESPLLDRAPGSTTAETGIGGSSDPGSAFDHVEPAPCKPEEVDDIDDDAFEISFLNSTITGYEFLKRLGRGGQGTVYKAVQKSTRRVVAIKVLHESQSGGGARQARFRREVALVARQQHPNIAAVFDSGLALGRPFVVMEFIEGLPIDKFAMVNELPVESIVSMMAKVIRAVGACHVRGVIHRDLKPQNVLVDLDGEPHLLDFGLAISFDDDSEPTAISRPGQIVGTLPFLSPEQALGKQDEVDTRSDIYALGIILYLLLSGEMPYPTDGDLNSVIRNIAGRKPGRLAGRRGEALSPSAGERVSRDLESIVLKSLSKDPGRRYQSADAFADDLARFLARDVVEARADSRWYLLRRTARRYRRDLIIAACFSFVLLGGIVGTFVMRQRANQIAQESQLAMRMGGMVKLSTTKRDERRLDQAIFYNQSTIEIGSLVHDPNVMVRRLICAAHVELAQIYLEKKGMLEDAEIESQIAIALATQWAQTEPDEDEYERILATCTKIQGRIFTKKEFKGEAVVWHRRAAARFAALAARNPDNEDLRFEALFASQLYAKSLNQFGDRDKALLVYERVHQGLTALCDRNPFLFDYLIELARTENFIAFVLLSDEIKSDDSEASCLLDLAERRLQDAISSGAAAARQWETQGILNNIAHNKKLILKRQTKDNQPRPSPPSSPSTGLSSPSSSGSESESFQKE